MPCDILKCCDVVHNSAFLVRTNAVGILVQITSVRRGCDCWISVWRGFTMAEKDSCVQCSTWSNSLRLMPLRTSSMVAWILNQVRWKAFMRRHSGTADMAWRRASARRSGVPTASRQGAQQRDAEGRCRGRRLAVPRHPAVTRGEAGVAGDGV
jgi:hypothetical protein